MKTIRTFAALTIVFVFGLLSAASAQTPGSVDVSFARDASTDGVVQSIVAAGDGTVYIGGSFTRVRGVPCGRIARLDGNGEPLPEFNAAIRSNDTVHVVALQEDGKVLIGGSFPKVNGIVLGRIARLNADGSLDASFDPGMGADNTIHSIAVQRDGKVLIGGSFTGVDGRLRNRIARLNADGSLDASFDPGMGADNTIRSIAVQEDGKVMIGGSFTSVNGMGRNRIARLNADGSLDVSFYNDSDENGDVVCIALQRDGKVVIGSSGFWSNHMARLNADGSRDTTFTPGSGRPEHPGAGPDGAVNCVALQEDGKMVIGGRFTRVNWTTRNRIARLNADGSLDNGFNPGSGADGSVNSVALQADGGLLIGGDFTRVNGVARQRIARLNSSGALDLNFNLGSGLTPEVRAMSLQRDGKVVIGGMGSGGLNKSLGRLNEDGSLDVGFHNNSNVNGDVDCVALQMDGKMVIGGAFTMVNGTARNRIARLNADGSLDASFNPGSGADGTVSCVALQADGKVLIGGVFTRVNGATRNRITRLNADGSLDQSFNAGTGPNDAVSAVAFQENRAVLIAGAFTSVNGTVRNRIARLTPNGSLDFSFDPVGGADSLVRAMALQADGKVMIGGSFNTVNGTRRNRIARLNADGRVDTSFNPGSGVDARVYSMALQADGKVVIGGNFGTVNGFWRNRIARLNPDGSLDNGFSVRAGANNEVRCVALQGDGKVVIGGLFTAMNLMERGGTARLHNDIAISQLLLMSSDRIEWRRAGCVPEVQAVEFMFLSNGLDWIPLGAGSRIDRGWQRTGFDLPAAGQIRALGRGFNGYGPIIVDAVSTYSRFGAVPEAAVSGNGLSIASGAARPRAADHTEFGSAVLGGEPVVRTFTISNLGNAPLALTGSPRVTISGSEAFSVSSQPATPTMAGAGDSTTFSVRFAPSTVGVHRATVNIACDDPDENPFTFSLAGTCIVLAEIAVRGNGANISSGDATPAPVDHTDLGGVGFTSAPAVRVFTIINEGTAPLVLTGSPRVAISGAGFSVIRQPATAVVAPGGGSATFELSFFPLVAGPHSAVVSIACDDADENPFTFAVAGIGLGAPDIAVSGNGVDIPHGWQLTGRDDHTEFGSVTIGTYAPSRHFTITNHGNAPLVLAATPSLRVRSGSSDFEVTRQPAESTVAPFGGTATFEVRFYPWNVGRRLSEIEIESDDPDERRFRFRVGGIVFDSFIVDTSFAPAAGVTGPGLQVTEQEDGQLLFAGGYLNMPEASAFGIVRLKPDGNFEPSFNPLSGFGGGISSMSLQQDGKPLVTGAFTRVNFATRHGIARLNTDGVLDGTFNPPVMTGSTITAMRVQRDGKILIARRVTDAFQITVSTAIERLNTDGSRDTSFNTGSGVNDTVNCMALQADGKLIIGGFFSAVNGIPRYKIARLHPDGSVDEGFDARIVFGLILDLYLQGDGKVLIAGYFTSVNGTPRNNIARLNADGSLDAGFDVGPGPNENVHAVIAQRDGKILIAGDFVAVSGYMRRRIARLHPDGRVDIDANPGTSANATISSLLELNDGKVMILGIFTGVNGMPRPGIARVHGSLTPRPSQLFSSALSAAPLSGAFATGEAMPFGDGVNNLLKYAFNMNLAGQDSRIMAPGGTEGLPAIASVTDGAGRILRFEFVRRIGSGLIYTPQKSPDPGNPASWVPLTDTPSVLPIDPGWERVIYEEPYDPVAAPRFFGRVQVRLP